MKNLVVPIILLFAGCIGHRIDLEQTNRVTVKTEAPDNYTINATAYEQDGSLRLLGRVAKSPFSVTDVRGHVDVEISDPQGTVLHSRATLSSLPAARHRARPASFALTVPAIPPNGSMIVVTYNPKSHQDFPMD